MNELIPKNKYYTIKKCELCKKDFESLTKRNQRFCCGKCSSEFTGMDKNRIAKIKKTKLEKYGDENYVNVDKLKRTCLSKYGVDNASKSPIVIEKIKSTNRERFGVDWTFQSESVKRKIEDSNLDKYGTIKPSQSDIIKIRVKGTVREKYGCDNVFQNETIKDKIYSTNIEKYGSKTPINSPELKAKSMSKNRILMWEKLKLNHKLNLTVTMLSEQSEYINTHRSNKYKFRCNTCEDIFEDHIDGGHIPRCLKCKPYIKGFSLMEKEVHGYIRSILRSDVEVKEKCRDIISGELDIVIPSKNIAVEFNGTYWHSDVAGGKDRRYHLNKTEQCFKKGIKLIHIFEDEWVNRQDVVKSRLKHILGVSLDKKIHARKCEIMEVSSKECNLFLEKHHLQGKCNSSARYGLFYENKLVSVMTFGKMRISLGNSNKPDEYEMYRHCSDGIVVGGSSKLFKHFLNTHKPIRVISYSDRRWGTGEIYDKLGFSFISNTTPNYFYIKYGQLDRLHRYNFSKHRLKDKLEKFDKNLTEWQNMQMNGYDRIWDCGHGKWVFETK